MQLKTIGEIKLELKRLRKQQNLHRNDDKIARQKSKLRSMLWKLLRQQPHSKPSIKAKVSRPAKDESRSSSKIKGSRNYT